LFNVMILLLLVSPLLPYTTLFRSPGLIRQYSLCNDPTDTKRYVIAVLKSESGLGGSKTLHETLRVQDMVRVSVPRNHFPLQPDRSEEHTSELQSRENLVCRLLLEK